MTREVQQVYFPDRKSWREWLAKNHDQVRSIWLVHDKVSQGEKLTYEDIVEEALCFGWIDSTVKKVDEQRSQIYLSVRKPKSIWAKSNKDRVEKLIKTGQMTRPGLGVIERAKEDGSWTTFDVVEDLVLPDELKKAFVKNKKAAANFENFSTSLRKQILYYIYSAKQTKTREQRANKLLPSLEAGKNPFI